MSNCKLNKINKHKNIYSRNDSVHKIVKVYFIRCSFISRKTKNSEQKSFLLVGKIPERVFFYLLLRRLIKYSILFPFEIIHSFRNIHFYIFLLFVLFILT